MNNTILVTGADGFVGRALCAALSELGERVIPASRNQGLDLAAAHPYQRWQEESIDAVIHLAAASFVPQSWEDPVSFSQTNVLGTLKTLEFCRVKRARMIYFSSYVYGTPQKLPISEAHPISPNNPYALSKYQGEEWCRFYAAHREVPCVVIRPFNLYGPGQSERFLLGKILAQWRRHQKVTVSDLRPRRDYVYIDDAICACLAIFSHARFAGETYNICSGVSVSVAEVLAIFKKVLGESFVWFEDYVERQGEILDVVGSSRLSREGLWQPKIPLAGGIERLVHA